MNVDMYVSSFASGLLGAAFNFGMVYILGLGEYIAFCKYAFPYLHILDRCAFFIIA